MHIASVTSRRGFTLVEILIVVLIISFVSLLAIPAALGSIRDSTFTSRAREVVGVLEEARTQALASRVIRYDIGGDEKMRIPPGGYGVFISVPDQAATLFVDDWNATSNAVVDMDYIDLSHRMLPDGIYTPSSTPYNAVSPDGDRLVRQVSFTDREWMDISSLSGTLLSGGAWAHTPSNELTLIFQPPYADVTMRTGTGDDLLDFSLDLTLYGDVTRTQTIDLHKVTTTAKMTRNTTTP